MQPGEGIMQQPQPQFQRNMKANVCKCHPSVNAVICVCSGAGMQPLVLSQDSPGRRAWSQENQDQAGVGGGGGGGVMFVPQLDL